MESLYDVEPYLEFYNVTPAIPLRDYYKKQIIIIPLVVGVCVSLPALIWAFHVFYTLRKHGGRISPFAIFLIINDLAELLLSAIIASYVIDSLVKSSATISSKNVTEENTTLIWLHGSTLTYHIHLLFTFRTSGLYLHQLVALRSIISLKRQLCSTYAFSPLRSTISCIILWLLAFGCQFLYIWLYLVFSFLPCCILAITYVLTCKASSAPDHIKPSSAVLIVSTLTLITSCVTTGLAFALIIHSHYFYIYREGLQFSSFLINLRVISDPLLCVLVCKKQLRVQKQQTHTEMNTDQRSV